MELLMNQTLSVSTILDKYKKSVSSYNLVNNSATSIYTIIILHHWFEKKQEYSIHYYIMCCR